MKFKLLMLLLWQGTSWALPDIPSFTNCPDVIHNSGFQNQSQPSNGTGGTFPFNGDMTVFYNGSDRKFFLYIPSSYEPLKPMPVLSLLMPQSTPGDNEAVAELVHDSWVDTAEAYQFITITQVSTGSSGGWVPSTDSQILSSIFNKIQNEYNVELARRYLWGFSAGAHVGMAIALQNADYFAAIAVNAGTLSQFAGTSAPFSAVRKIAFIQSIGTSDPLYSQAQSDRNTFTSAGWLENENYILNEFSGGHVWPNDADEIAADFLCDKSFYD